MREAFWYRVALLDEELHHVAAAAGLDDAEAAGIRHARDLCREAATGDRNELGTHADLGAALASCRRAVVYRDGPAGKLGLAAVHLAGKNVHTGGADEVADKGVLRLLEEFDRRPRLHDLAHRLEAQGANIAQYLEATGQEQDAFVAGVREGSTGAVKADL